MIWKLEPWRLIWDAAAVQTIFVLSVLKSLQPSTDASHLLVSYDTSIFTQALKLRLLQPLKNSTLATCANIHLEWKRFINTKQCRGCYFLKSLCSFRTTMTTQQSCATDVEASHLLKSYTVQFGVSSLLALWFFFRFCQRTKILLSHNRHLKNQKPNEFWDRY